VPFYIVYYRICLLVNLPILLSCFLACLPCSGVSLFVFCFVIFTTAIHTILLHKQDIDVVNRELEKMYAPRLCVWVLCIMRAGGMVSW